MACHGMTLLNSSSIDASYEIQATKRLFRHDRTNILMTCHNNSSQSVCGMESASHIIQTFLFREYAK